jgi:cell wall assembly regulator SMI1
MRAERLSAIENSLGASIPGEYRTFLATHEGRDEAGLYVSSNPEYWGVRQLYEIGDEAEYHQLDETYRLVRDVLPPSCLPIAEDWSGNFYLLSCSGENKGQVYWWNHERDRGDFSVEHVANSFTEFLRLLAHEET